MPQTHGRRWCRRTHETVLCVADQETGDSIIVLASAGTHSKFGHSDKLDCPKEVKLAREKKEVAGNATHPVISDNY